jgi:hypothetical protein
LDNLQGELRKLKPPSFDGEREKEDDVEAWLLESGSIFNCTTIHLILKQEFPHTICMENLLCGGIN